MSADPVVMRLLEGDNLFLVVGGLIAVTAIVAGCLTKVIRSAHRERSRREIAAYIAEGSMTPEQGERLLSAGGVKRDGCC